jgi:hypothetical protein
MEKNVFACASYLNDLMVSGDDFVLCKRALDFLVVLIVDVGLEVN